MTVIITPIRYTYAIAWICGRQKERMCKLTGGLRNSGKYLFCDRKFVLHKDLMDKEKGLLCENSLSIVCEVHEFTNEVSYINNWLLDPLKSTMVHSTKYTLGNDLKEILDAGENSDVVLVARDGREFPAHTINSFQSLNGFCCHV